MTESTLELNLGLSSDCRDDQLHVLIGTLGGG